MKDSILEKYDYPDSVKFFLRKIRFILKVIFVGPFLIGMFTVGTTIGSETFGYSIKTAQIFFYIFSNITCLSIILILITVACHNVYKNRKRFPEAKYDINFVTVVVPIVFFVFIFVAGCLFLSSLKSGFNAIFY